MTVTNTSLVDALDRYSVSVAELMARAATAAPDERAPSADSTLQGLAVILDVLAVSGIDDAEAEVAALLAGFEFSDETAADDVRGLVDLIARQLPPANLTDSVSYLRAAERASSDRFVDLFVREVTSLASAAAAVGGVDEGELAHVASLAGLSD